MKIKAISERLIKYALSVIFKLALSVIYLSVFIWLNICCGVITEICIQNQGEFGFSQVCLPPTVIAVSIVALFRFTRKFLGRICTNHEIWILNTLSAITFLASYIFQTWQRLYIVT